MSNVLPSEARTRLLSDQRGRFVHTTSLFLSAAAIVALIALLPAYLAVALPRMTLSEAHPSSSAGDEGGAEEDKKTSARTRILLSALAPFAEEVVPIHELIRRIEELRPRNVTISSIVYEDGPPSGISLSGSARGREQVNAFREALLKEPHFKTVSVPVAALVGASDGNFRMTITGTF